MSSEEQRLVIFEENGSGDYKIAGIEVYGTGLVIKAVHNIQGVFPEFMDDPEKYIPSVFRADLVLDFLHHPDLSEYLVSVCNKQGIPVISSGKRIPGAVCPFTCCGLGRKKGLGRYAEQFGLPEFRIALEHGVIRDVSVIRGASCGATWQVTGRLKGMAPENAVEVIGREIQYICTADPSAFDPVTGHSALHFAGDVHIAALKRALDTAS